MKFFAKLLIPLLALTLALAPASAQFSGSGPGFRISDGPTGPGDGRTLPANTVLPVISGSAVVGATLTTTTGTWTGSPSPSFTYQWKRNGVAIGSATSSTYLLVSADAGTTTTVTVTGLNNAGTVAVTTTGVGPVVDAVAAFLARTSGLDATHVNAYTALINSLISHGIWSKLDVLHIYATQDSTTALLNLISTSYNAITHGSPTFTADRGFTGVDTSSTVYIDTQFNPVTATTPVYAQNSAHMSAWVLNNVTSNQPTIGSYNGSNTDYLYSKFVGDGKAYFRINVTAVAGQQGVANSDARGHYISNRSTSSAIQGYMNGSSIFSDGAQASIAPPSLNIYALGGNNNGTAAGTGQQEAELSLGSNLNSTDAGNFYGDLRTYMTAVGVP